MSSFFMALSFLTIFPWWGNTQGNEEDMARSLYFYPVVGGLLGGVLAAVYLWADYLALGIAGAGLVVVLWMVFTGGLHTDGLMDAADSFFSGKSPREKLEIMRDSRVGAMGVMALLGVVLLKFVFLDALPLTEAVAALILAPMVGRLAMVWAISRYAYARSEPGLGGCFGEKRPLKPFYLGCIVLIVVAFLVNYLILEFTMLPFLWVLIVLLLAMGKASMIAKNIGGHTGDTYGFLGEISEMLLLITMAIGMSI